MGFFYVVDSPSVSIMGSQLGYAYVQVAQRWRDFFWVFEVAFKAVFIFASQLFATTVLSVHVVSFCVIVYIKSSMPIISVFA